MPVVEPINYEAVARYEIEMMPDGSCVLVHVERVGLAFERTILDTGDLQAVVVQLAMALAAQYGRLKSEAQADARLRQGSAGLGI